MYHITSVLMLIVLTDRGHGELSLGNTPCPSVCVCNGNKTTCEGHLRYIPPLPEKTTDLEFISNKLGYLDENSFKNISSLNLTRLSIKRRINHIDKPAFLMLPHLQYLDLSGNVGLHSGNLRKAFHGLRNSALREISLRYMRFHSLYKDFFSDLSNTSLERIHLDGNVISSNVGDLMSPLSIQLREISFKSNRISNVSFNMNMPKMEIFILGKNNLVSVPNFCYEPGHQPRFPNLKVLDLSDNLIAFVKENTFYRNCFPKLQNLSLGFNKIKTLGKNFINHMPSILYLSIENLDPDVTLHEFSLNSSSLQYL